MTMRKLLESMDKLSLPDSDNAPIRAETGYADGSADFENDVSEVEQALQKIRTIVSSPDWNDWMKSTDENYIATAQARNRDLKEAINKAQLIFNDLYNHLTELS
jgi:hypothetical protein